MLVRPGMNSPGAELNVIINLSSNLNELALVLKAIEKQLAVGGKLARSFSAGSLPQDCGTRVVVRAVQMETEIVHYLSPYDKKATTASGPQQFFLCGTARDPQDSQTASAVLTRAHGLRKHVRVRKARFKASILIAWLTHTPTPIFFMHKEFVHPRVTGTTLSFFIWAIAFLLQ